MANGFQLSLFFHVTESGEVVGDFALGAWGGRGDFLTFFQGADFLQGEGVSLDGGGGVDVPGSQQAANDENTRLVLKQQNRAKQARYREKLKVCRVVML